MFRATVGAMTEALLPPGRLIALDAARTLAVVCMVIFHFTFDLALFGYIPSDTIYQPFWYYFARMIAGSFLFLAGVSLWLAHGQGIRWQAFWIRFGKVAGAALLVTIASIQFVPGGTIWFGILHAIAAASLLGLIALRLPWPVTLALAAAIFAAAWGPRFAAFDPLWLVWTGLAETRPAMGDYVPLVPWAAPLLAGIAFARALGIDRWRGRAPSPLVHRLTFPGRHSLIIYLAHQPILIGLFNAYIWATGPS
ncbi:heparan-alpha-glucosaminide N-acetyltransferase [Tabrizicola sp.]|uniref:heparan-alpha-glucosaminide N-acetyltransferase n=1 Tax=Tabrizicola sp. TaxID=2005166 RepID=UPI003F328D51